MQTQTVPTGNALLEKAKGIDRIASAAMALYEGASSMEAELGVAQAISDLRAALTPDIMRPIMALMNTELGFLTDKDPRKPDKHGKIPTPYSSDEVRDVLIEAKLRGFHTIGNEFNIISRRFYAAKAGLKRRCEQWPGVVALKISIGLPRNSANGQGAVVPIEATWTREGIADAIKTEVAVKVNEYMGADAITGKAERKLYKRVFDRLSGRVTPDGEVGDDDTQPQLPTAPPAPIATALPAPPVTPEPKTEPAPPTAAAQTTAATLPVNIVTIPTAQPAALPPETGNVGITVNQSQLAEIVADAGATIDNLRDWATSGLSQVPVIANIDWDCISDFFQVPEPAAAWFVKNQTGVKSALRRWLTVQAGGAQ